MKDEQVTAVEQVLSDLEAAFSRHDAVLLEAPAQPFFLVHGHIRSSVSVNEMTGGSDSM